MISIEINKYLTLAIAVGVLMLGQFLRKRIRFLETFCIPAPVVGGLVVAIVSCILYVCGIVEFIYDDTFREICMVFFFTSVGFQANLAVLKEGGKDLIVFLLQVTFSQSAYPDCWASIRWSACVPVRYLW